jgi:hypothetical protein
MSRFCPTCGRATVDVATGAPASTGEWAAVMPPDDGDALSAPTPMPYAGSDRCSWCGKAEAQVRRLLTGPGVQICDECVSFCALILRDDVTP